jgi:hypothetical protein
MQRSLLDGWQLDDLVTRAGRGEVSLWHHRVSELQSFESLVGSGQGYLTMGSKIHQHVRPINSSCAEKHVQRPGAQNPAEQLHTPMQHGLLMHSVWAAGHWSSCAQGAVCCWFCEATLTCSHPCCWLVAVVSYLDQHSAGWSVAASDWLMPK